MSNEWVVAYFTVKCIPGFLNGCQCTNAHMKCIVLVEELKTFFFDKFFTAQAYTCPWNWMSIGFLLATVLIFLKACRSHYLLSRSLNLCSIYIIIHGRKSREKKRVQSCQHTHTQQRKNWSKNKRMDRTFFFAKKGVLSDFCVCAADKLINQFLLTFVCK